MKIKSILLDFLVFLAPTLVFNTLFLCEFQGARDGILLNIYLVFLIWVILTAFRLVLALFIPDRYMLPINVTLMAGTWLSMVVFYSLCLVGLTAWGRLPTITILKVYASQINSVVGVLNISWLTLALIAFAILGILLILYKLIWNKVFWLSALSCKLRPTLSLFTFSSVSVIGVILFWQNFSYGDGDNKNEAFYEVLFPEFKSKMIQNWRVSSSKFLEKEANESREHYKKSQYKSRNIILIVIDALRADHLSVNGYPRQTTPFISSLDHNGQLQSVSPVRSVCAESTCGVLALSRAKYPNSITAVDFSFYEVLKRYGYKIHFFLSGDHTNFYHLKDAYKPYDTYLDESPAPEKHLSGVNDDQFLIQELKKLPNFNGNPTFIQFHLMSVHGLGVRYKKEYPYSPAQNYYNALSWGRIKGDESSKLGVVNYYDNGVSQADTIISNIFSELKVKGYLDNALVIITADHGELLGEGGFYAHSKTIEEHVLNIPLIVWSSEVNDPALNFKKRPVVSQVDIAPTILRALNINIPSSWQGVALQDYPRDRNIFVSQGAAVGVYSYYKGTVYKLTLDRNKALEQSWSVTFGNSHEATLLKASVPSELLKEMRAQLYKIDM